MDYKQKKVLVAEDDDMLRNIITGQLAAVFTVAEAKDGEEALSKIESDRPDVLILDILMPKIDGFGVLEKLRGKPDPGLSKLPVLVVSNLTDQTSIQRAKQYDIEDYFTKNDISFGILVNRIKRIFNSN